MMFRLFNCRKEVRRHHSGSSPLFLILFLLVVINCIPRWPSSLKGVTVFARQEEEEGKRVVVDYPQLSPVDPWMQCIDSIFDQLVLNNPTSPHMDPDNLGNKHEDSVFKWKLFEAAGGSSRNISPRGGNGRGEEEVSSSSPLTTKSSQKNPCGYSPITDHKFQKDIFYYQSTPPSSFSDETSRPPSRPEDREEEEDAKPSGSEKQRRGGGTKRRVISLVGDSTMNRFWMYTINRQLHPKKQFKVGTPLEYSPDQTTYSQGGSDFKFYKVRWASTGAEQIKRAILDARGGAVEKEDGATREPGVVIFALGAWDLQFNLQPRNKRSPGVLVNHNLTYALEAWSIYLPRFMKALVSALRSIEKAEDRPSVLIRDTWLPWCPADRFHKRAWRDCDKLLRPAVAPLYRRTLNSLAWSLGIPVIPVDPLFANNYQFCAVGDGIHLSWSCYNILQEVVWNSVLIVDKQRRDKDNPLVQGEWYNGGRRKIMRSSSSGRGTSGSSGGAMMISDLVPDFLDTFPDLKDKSPFRGKKKSKQQQEEDNSSRQQVQIEPNPSSSNSSEKQQRQQWSYWPLTAFFNPSVYDSWSRGFRRKQPGGVDTHAIWLVAQKSDRVFWLKNGTNPPGKPPPWQPEKLGGHANYTDEIMKVEAWFAPPETGRLPVESGNTDRERMPKRAESEDNNKLNLPPTSAITASGDGTNVVLVETKAVSITSQPAQQEALQPTTENLVVKQTSPVASPIPHHPTPSSSSSSSSVPSRGRSSSGSSPDLTTYVLVFMVVGFAAWQQWGTLQKMFFGSTPTTSSTSSSGADHGED